MDDAALTKVICEQLGALPDWEWNETGEPYSADVVGVFYGAIDPTPHRAIGVRVYGATDDRLAHLGWRRVQLRSRGAPGQPDGADQVADAGFGVLQGLSRLGGISDVSRLSMAPLGADENRREERTDNYTIILDNQETFA